MKRPVVKKRYKDHYERKEDELKSLTKEERTKRVLQLRQEAKKKIVPEDPKLVVKPTLKHIPLVKRGVRKERKAWTIKNIDAVVQSQPQQLVIEPVVHKKETEVKKRKISIFIFSYERKEMLERLLAELEGYDVTIIDDGSCFELDHPGFVKLPHGGKAGFWRNWDHALKLFKKSNSEFALFLQDDLVDIKIDKILEYHNRFKDNPYVFNAWTDNRQSCWNSIVPEYFDDALERIGFIDCVFFANKSAFKKIGYTMIPIDKQRFIVKGISSGVGQQLTKRINNLKIPIYRSKTSLVRHGEHESKMHPEERLKHPLITIHDKE